MNEPIQEIEDYFQIASNMDLLLCSMFPAEEVPLEILGYALDFTEAGKIMSQKLTLLMTEYQRWKDGEIQMNEEEKIKYLARILAENGRI